MEEELKKLKEKLEETNKKGEETNKENEEMKGAMKKVLSRVDKLEKELAKSKPVAKKKITNNTSNNTVYNSYAVTNITFKGKKFILNSYDQPTLPGPIGVGEMCNELLGYETMMEYIFSKVWLNKNLPENHSILPLNGSIILCFGRDGWIAGAEKEIRNINNEIRGRIRRECLTGNDCNFDECRMPIMKKKWLEMGLESMTEKYTKFINEDDKNMSGKDMSKQITKNEMMEDIITIAKMTGLTKGKLGRLKESVRSIKNKEEEM
jgi:hypothetical protein